jgi:ParB family chromosome partitioning protein
VEGIVLDGGGVARLLGDRVDRRDEVKIAVDLILSNPEQPRKEFDALAMEELVRSIKSVGLLQPVVVEEAGDQFILIDGERRLRACKLASFAEIEAIVRPSMNGNGKRDRLAMALIANLQREDLNPIEEARGYQKLMDTGMTGRQLSVSLGIGEVKIFNSLKLLQLDEPIQKLIAAGKFTSNMVTVQALLKLPDAQARVMLAEKLAARGLGKNGKALANSIEQLSKRLEGQIPYTDEKAPAAELAQKGQAVDLPKWDIIYQAGKAPSWGVVYKAALETCNACPLRPAASEITCRSCQAAKLLREMIEQGTHEAARLMAGRAVQSIALKKRDKHVRQPG